MQQDQNLVSIERVVAFVLGPLITAASGALSGWLVANLGVQVSATQVMGAFATGGTAAAALLWKWLHGRQACERDQTSAASAAKDLGDAMLSATTGFAKAHAGPIDPVPPPVEPIPPAADPAPASTQAPPVAQQADAGAATPQ